MARGSTAATTAATTAQGQAQTNYGNANALYGPLSGMLMSQAANPQGMSPLDIARTDTASQQGAGGGQAAAVGQGALLAGRTRNAGTADAAIARATRTSGEQLAQDTLQTRLRDAAMKAGERSAAMSGLGSLYGTTMGAGNTALGIVPSAVNANTQAQNASWDWATDIMAPLVGAAGASSQTMLKAFGG